MSGGSYDYAFRHVQDMAANLRCGRNGHDPLRVAFAEHLEKVAKAMHDVEWVDSCDYGKGQEAEAIRAVIAPGAELDAAIDLAELARRKLDDSIQMGRLLLREQRR